MQCSCQSCPSSEAFQRIVSPLRSTTDLRAIARIVECGNPTCLLTERTSTHRSRSFCRQQQGQHSWDTQAVLAEVSPCVTEYREEERDSASGKDQARNRQANRWAETAGGILKNKAASEHTATHSSRGWLGPDIEATTMAEDLVGCELACLLVEW